MQSSCWVSNWLTTSQESSLPHKPSPLAQCFPFWTLILVLWYISTYIHHGHWPDFPFTKICNHASNPGLHHCRRNHKPWLRPTLSNPCCRGVAGARGSMNSHKFANHDFAGSYYICSEPVLLWVRINPEKYIPQTLWNTNTGYQETNELVQMTQYCPMQ